MNPIEITIRSEHGYLFEGEYPLTYAFVPKDCVRRKEDGAFSIDTLCYFQKRWGGRNMHFNSAEAPGSRLFPDEKKPVSNANAPGLGVFLERLRRGYGAGFSIHEAVNA